MHEHRSEPNNKSKSVLIKLHNSKVTPNKLIWLNPDMNVTIQSSS